MNPDLDKLQPYPFEKLASLKQGTTPPAGLAHIALSIGEPKHPTPGFIAEGVIEHLHLLSSYPTTKGVAPLREAIAGWVERRFRAKLDPERQILPVNGTREALFAFAQAAIDRTTAPAVLMPNPFYQIYEGAALLAGAEPHYLNCTAANGFIPDYDAVSDEQWRRCQLLFLCSPGNPTGAVTGRETLRRLIELADRHDFILAADECYSEIYPDEENPPPGLLQVAAEMGRDDFRRCIVFHSLSKRSNAPGLRSGFVAGDAAVIQALFRYRTYHGCAMPPAHQAASIAAWNDEHHVRANRDAYREKFQRVLTTLDGCLETGQPDAGFYLWAKAPGTDTDLARELYAECNLTVLPGSYLSRQADGINPGDGYIRMALVAPLEECLEAASRIERFLS
ncbi:succinyldiaminopimelate transaminase [Endothiovibrio diazotrophicus]